MRFEALRGAAAAVAVLMAAPAVADPVTYTFHATVDAGTADGLTPGPFDGQTGTGSFTFDPDDLPGGTGVLPGLSFLPPPLDADFDFEISIFGGTFTTSDANNIDSKGALSVIAGEPTALAFNIDKDVEPIPSGLPLNGVDAFGTINGSTLVASEKDFDFEVSLYARGQGQEPDIIPLPATGVLLIGGMVGLAALRRRKS